ncbi:L,D-transpeptidase family protein [Streptomyces sp. NPDC047017]|uniref:L,D-transpeptidase family protein n=1 Tax=Streptomyces sp. NPDC047017 TaxID=3155024 RepID=UPI0033E155E6
MRRPAVAVAAAVALSGVYGCTVRDPGAGTDGRSRPPVRVEVPGTRSPGAGTPIGGGRTGAPGAGGGPSRTATRTPAPAQPPAPAPKPTRTVSAPVLWSRGDSGRAVRAVQARLRQVGWLSNGPTGTYDAATERAVQGFQGKRGLPRTGRTDTVTWQRLVAMTHEPGQWELYLMGGQPAGAPDARCLTGRVLCIDKTTRTLRWMIDGRTVSTMAVRFGTEETPTRDGVFQVYWKSRDHVSTIYHTPMPYAMFFSGGQAVHYSSDFAARGYAGGSHGCVNVRDEAAIARLFAQVKEGDKVVVHR